MCKLLKFIGCLIALAGIAVGVYYAVTKFLQKKDELEDSDEICCFDEDEIELEAKAEEEAPVEEAPAEEEPKEEE